LCLTTPCAVMPAGRWGAHSIIFSTSSRVIWIAPAVVETRFHARPSAARFEEPAMFEIDGDAGRTEGMAAELSGDARRRHGFRGR